MGETIIEKIIRHNTGKSVKPGDIVTVNVDRVMIHDIFIPFVAEKFEEMGFSKLYDPEKVILIYDHLVPASQLDDTRHFRIGDAFAAKYGMPHVHRSDGICHQLMTEAGYVKPGDVVFGTDSHTTTYGCVGAFSSGIGYTEMASILGTGTMWIKVPETIKVVIEGELPANVMSKDIILRLIGDLGADGATYKALEFFGSTVDNMSVASRMTMSNMAVEAGAKTGIFEPDEKAIAYLEEHGRKPKAVYHSDPDAVYAREYTFDLSKIRPVVAKPDFVDNLCPAEEVRGIKIDEAFLGSCNNGRIEDLRVGASILKGHKVADSVRFLVVPASLEIYKQALKEGLIDIFMDAGAIVMNPNCSVCWGSCQGVIGENEVLISTGTRNFKGRAGHPSSKVYLGSAATVTASAIAGKIALAEDIQ